MAADWRGRLGIDGLPNEDDADRLVAALGVDLVYLSGEPGCQTPYGKPARVILPLTNCSGEFREVALLHELGHALLNYRWRMQVLWPRRASHPRAAERIDTLRLRQEAMARMFAASWFNMPESEHLFCAQSAHAAVQLIRDRRTTAKSGDPL